MQKAAVVYFSRPQNHERMKSIAQAVAKGIESQGVVVDLLDGSKSRDSKLTGYGYLSIGCDVRSLFKGLVSPELKSFLANCGHISGKRASAFLLHSSLGSVKTMTQLMRSMEHEGLMLRYSDILKTTEDASAFGRGLKIQ